MESGARPVKSPGNDTIAAAATGTGGGIGIVRISGPGALAVAAKIFRSRGGARLEERDPFLLVLGSVCDPDTSEPIDEVFAAHMPQGRSYTGEPTVELQGHGGRVVLEAVLQASIRAGARHAGPGEFTKRAFLNGRLDLTQAEAVARLICAEDDASRRAALRQLQGAVADQVNRLREQLVDLVADLEAALDFEEGEIPDDPPTPAQMENLAGEIRQLAGQASVTAGSPGRVRIAFAGRANSGKSSIFNYLLNYERSLVSPLPGTTRDYIEAQSLIGGASVTLIDTAGFRITDDFIEAEGVRRSTRLINEAAIVILVIDGSEPLHQDVWTLFDLASGRSPILVISKGDLPTRIDAEAFLSRTSNLPRFTVSTVTGEGFPDFVAAVTSRCSEAAQAPGHQMVGLNVRHRDALERAAEHLETAARQARSGAGILDQSALELLAALAALGEITGQTATEEILDRIFSRFCVGK